MLYNTYTMPEWLKTMFSVTSTVISISIVAVIIYVKKSSNCLSMKQQKKQEDQFK